MLAPERRWAGRLVLPGHRDDGLDEFTGRMSLAIRQRPRRATLINLVLSISESAVIAIVALGAMSRYPAGSSHGRMETTPPLAEPTTPRRRHRGRGRLATAPAPASPQQMRTLALESPESRRRRLRCRGPHTPGPASRERRGRALAPSLGWPGHLGADVPQLNTQLVRGCCLPDTLPRTTDCDAFRCGSPHT